MVKSKKVEGVQIRAQGPCPILCDVHAPESPSQRPMGTAIRGFNLSGMNQPVPARIQGVSGSGIPGHLDPPMQGARRIPESSAEGFGDSIMVVLKKVPCPAFGRGGLCRLPAGRLGVLVPWLRAFQHAGCPVAGGARKEKVPRPWWRRGKERTRVARVQ